MGCFASKPTDSGGNRRKPTSIGDVSVYVPGLRIPKPVEFSQSLGDQLPKTLVERLTALRTRIVVMANQEGPTITRTRRKTQHGGSTLADLHQALEDYLPVLLGLTKDGSQLQFKVQFNWINQEDEEEETAMPNVWYEVLSVLHLMAMLQMSQANLLLLPRGSTDGYHPKVSEENRRASIDVFLRAAGYLDCAVKHVLPQFSAEQRRSLPVDLAEGALRALCLQALGQGVDIQLGIAIGSSKATLAVKRRLSCEMVKYWQQAQDNLTNLPLANGWGEKHMLFVKWKYVEAKAAAYYYHGLILDEGNTEKSHGMAVAALQAADECFKESKKASEAFNASSPTSRTPPLFGTMKYLSEKIPKETSSKVRINRDLYSYEKIMETAPTLPDFALALKPDEYQLKMEILPCFFLALFLTLVSSIFLKKTKNSKFNLPPSPSSFPIIGNLHHLAGLPHRCFHNLSIKYGPVVLLRLGSVPVVVISSSEAAEAVLKTHDLECCSRPKTVGTGKLSYGFKDITFSQYGAYWREMRKLAVIELFSLKKVQSFRYIREDEVGFVVKKVSEASLTQSPVDLSKTFFTLTASIICRVALGQNFHESDFFIDQEKIEELVTEATVALGDFTFSDFFPGVFGRFLDLLFQRHKRISKVFEELDAFYQHVIDDHLKPEGRKNQDIVSMMLDMIDEQGDDDSFKLNMDNVKAILMDVFLAGIDTSAVTMIWAMAELVKNPRVMKKAQENIRTTLGLNRERITEDDIGKVDYLKLIVKEIFRLHPALPFIIPRETMSHVKIQGYDIPPKTQIQINVWTIGRDPERWTDPEEFNPERFTDSSVDFRGQHYELLPFGSGRRMCPAMPMGVANVELALMNLLYFFDWGLPDGMKVGELDMEEAGNISIVKKIPLQLVPLRRY